MWCRRPCNEAGEGAALLGLGHWPNWKQEEPMDEAYFTPAPTILIETRCCCQTTSGIDCPSCHKNATSPSSQCGESPACDAQANTGRKFITACARCPSAAVRGRW